jgi:hypothetical protein
MLMITKRDQQVITPPVNDYSTTGSMEAGSYVLTCADASGFNTGDWVIVEIGGEAGGGLVNTDGVGGRQAAIGAAPWYPYYYYDVDQPLALCAQIMHIDDNVVQLDRPAYVATTDANVYFDNTPPWNRFVPNYYYYPNANANKTFLFPAGVFAYSQSIGFGHCNNANILGSADGETRIYSPKGCGTSHFDVRYATDVRYGRFVYEQNFKQHGWVWGIGRGIEMVQCTRPIMHDMTLIDRGPSGIEMHNCTNGRTFRLRSLRTEPFMAYTQWSLNDVHCDGSIWYDCRADSPNGLDKGFEMFRSTNTTFIRCGGINATYASGGASNFTIIGFWSIVKADSGLPLDPSYTNNTPIPWSNQSIMDITNNVGSWLNMSLGGTIHNPRLIQEDYITPEGGLLRSITVYHGANGPRDYKNIHITGDSY